MKRVWLKRLVYGCHSKMPRIQIISDLHGEARGSKCSDGHLAALVTPHDGASILVVAGDVGRAGSSWMRAFLAYCAARWAHVVVIRGNHDFFATRSWRAWKYAPPATPCELLQTLRADAAAAGANVHVLERETVELDGVTFLGAPCWTHVPRLDEFDVATRMTDYRMIAVLEQGTVRPAVVADTNAWHARDLAWLASTAAATPGPLVVVTHHQPLFNHAAITPPRYLGCSINSAFGCNATLRAVASTRGDVRLWICGHSHAAGRADARGIAVVCNAAGHPSERTGYSPRLVFDTDGGGGVRPVSPPPLPPADARADSADEAIEFL